VGEGGHKRSREHNESQRYSGREDDEEDNVEDEDNASDGCETIESMWRLSKN